VDLAITDIIGATLNMSTTMIVRGPQSFPDQVKFVRRTVSSYVGCRISPIFAFWLLFPYKMPKKCLFMRGPEVTLQNVCGYFGQ